MKLTKLVINLDPYCNEKLHLVLRLGRLCDFRLCDFWFYLTNTGIHFVVLDMYILVI